MNEQRLQILHVEDNPDHAHLVVRTLRRHPVGNEIHLVEDGEAALDYLFRRGAYQDPASSPRPHVILLDLRLPKIDGLEILQAIKSHEELLSIPVVVLTSSEAERDVVLAYGYHANSYLIKPVGFDRFTEMLQQLGFYWLGWNHYPCSARVN